MDQAKQEQLEAIEANLYFFILDNSALDPAYRPQLDAIYGAIASVAGVTPRELPPHNRPPSALHQFLVDIQAV